MFSMIVFAHDHRGQGVTAAEQDELEGHDRARERSARRLARAIEHHATSSR